MGLFQRLLRTSDLFALEITSKDILTKLLISIELSMVSWHRVETSPTTTVPVENLSMERNSQMRPVVLQPNTPTEDNFQCLMLAQPQMVVNSSFVSRLLHG